MIEHGKLDNRNSVLELIRTTVRNSEPDASIILYGSRARGDAREDSDWDVLAIVEMPVRIPNGISSCCLTNLRCRMKNAMR